MKWIWGIIITLAFIIVGGAREIIFVNINEQIEFTSGRKVDYHVLPYLQFLKAYSISTLENIKWALTVLTMAINLVLSLLAIRLVLRERRAISWLLILYGLGFAVAGASFVIGKLIGEYRAGYTLARVIMGALQSPFPLMMLIPALYLAPSQQELD